MSGAAQGGRSGKEGSPVLAKGKKGTHSFLGNVVLWRRVLSHIPEVEAPNDYKSQYRRGCSCEEAVEISHRAFRDLEFLH